MNDTNDTPPPPSVCWQVTCTCTRLLCACVAAGLLFLPLCVIEVGTWPKVLAAVTWPAVALFIFVYLGGAIVQKLQDLTEARYGNALAKFIKSTRPPSGSVRKQKPSPPPTAPADAAAQEGAATSTKKSGEIYWYWLGADILWTLGTFAESPRITILHGLEGIESNLTLIMERTDYAGTLAGQKQAVLDLHEEVASAKSLDRNLRMELRERLQYVQNDVHYTLQGL